MIRVSAVIDTFDVGGFELDCLELLRRFDRQRFEPRLYTFRPGALVDRARAAGIPVVVGHPKPASDTTWTDEDSRAREAWTQTLADGMAADQTDLCFVWAWPEAIEAARAASVPAIVERVDGPALSARVGDKSACTRVIVQSAHVRDVLVAQSRRFGLDPGRVVVIRSGVDLGLFDPRCVDRSEARSRLGIPADAFVSGTLARLSPEKNLGQLVDGFAAALTAESLLSDKGWLVLAGPDGGSRLELERRVVERGIAERVVFTGPVEDRASLLGALDVFGLTSYTEGTPAAVLEAMAMALPIVATPVGAVLEMLDENAVVVDVMAPHETALAIAGLALDDELRARLGARSRQLSRRWSMDRHVARYEAVLEEAVAEVGG